MKVRATEEFIMNPDSPIYGWRTFRLEYGGHTTECIIEGRIYIPPDKYYAAYDIINNLEEVLSS